ncbi:MAG: hypothetical protein ACK52S_14145 [Pirellula sp.]|jgi:hypothetical protein
MHMVPCEMDSHWVRQPRRLFGRLGAGSVTLLAFLAVSLIALSGDSYARCGASTRQMIWKTGSSSDLLTWDGATIGRDRFSTSGAAMDSTEHGERECTRCRCRKESERPLFPDLDLVKTSQPPVVSCDDGNGFEGAAPLSDFVSSIDATFFSRALGELDRPPRS